MYFSRIVPDSKAAFTRPRNFYNYHRFLWKFFPEDEGAKRDFLFRAEVRRGIPHFFMVSAREPSRLVDHWMVDVKPYQPDLRSGDRLAFSVRVNPSITVEGKRQDYIAYEKHRLGSEWRASETHSELLRRIGLQWFQKRGDRAGYRLDEETVRIENYRANKDHKYEGDRGRQAGSGRQRRNLAIGTLDAAGLLTVEDPKAFTDTLFQGLGPAKSFGCGLILVKRP